MKTPTTLAAQPAGPAYDTARRLSDALLFVMGFPVCGLAWEIYARRGESRFLLMVSLGLGLGGVVFLSGRVVVRAAVETLEKLSGWDVNRDGVVGDPGRVIVVNKQPIETKTTAEQFEAFVRQVAIDPAERRLLAQGFTDEQIGAWRDALIRAGLAQWVSPGSRKHGWRLCDGVDVEQILASLAVQDDA